jgi:hypothetical protein
MSGTRFDHIVNVLVWGGGGFGYWQYHLQAQCEGNETSCGNNGQWNEYVSVRTSEIKYFGIPLSVHTTALRFNTRCADTETSRHESGSLPGCSNIKKENHCVTLY